MKTVWVNGCFDVLHRGHIELFKYAKSLGDYLVVGLDTDQRVKRAKGISRPFNKLQDRMAMLEAIKYIDAVVSFDDDDELRYLVKFYNSDIMVVGSDWRDKRVVGQDAVKEVKFFSRIGEYSTTKILEST
jgi:rfaE bifunctional protein nucleotidyltransferase chain/domain